MNPAFKEVCRSPVCIDIMGKTCDKVLPCTHPCCGFKEEATCLPCLDPKCVEADQSKTNGVHGEEYCTICYTDGLNQGPCV